MKASEKKKITQHLIVRLLLILILCAGIFGFSAFLSNRESAQTIETVGDLYMHSMSEEIAFHVEAAINLYLGQLDDITADMQRNNPEERDFGSGPSPDGAARDFDYLALYSAEGEAEILYGESVSLEEDADAFLSDLEQGQRKVAAGTDAAGKKMILIGAPCSFPEKEGRRCMALVAGIEEEKINETISLGASDSPVYSYIIAIDGSPMIRSGETVRDNYFQRLYEEISENSEKHVAELREAMGDTGHYSKVLMVEGERRHFHCTKLKYTEWFLIVIMPYSSLDVSISKLSGNLLLISFGGFAIVLAALLWVFRSYFREIRRQMEELDKVRQEAVEANRAKSEFLSNMSHDIRTPMNAVVGMTAIAQANIDNKEQVQSCLKKIAFSSKHLLWLINDVLDMSRIESGKLVLNRERISLAEVVDGAANIIKPQTHAREQSFEVKLQDILTENVYSDSVRLSQVLLNLLGNSVKFTPKGGAIRLTVYEEESSRGGNYVCVHFLVEDNGIGMTAEFLEKIFEAFSRADARRVQKTEGSGLGMAITKYIVDAMEGNIEVQSQPEKGSCFHIILDLERAGADDIGGREQKARDAQTDFTGKRVLLAEDNDLNWEIARELLSGLGMELERAENGRECLEKFIKSPEGFFDLILMDVRMPVMTGYEATREIRSLEREDAGVIPIIAMTADAFAEDVKRCLDCGMNAHVAKPIDIRELSETMEKYTGRP